MTGYAQPCADHEYIDPNCSACGRIAEVPDQRHLLTFLEAQQAGEAMFSRWLGRHEEGECLPPPFDMGDLAWADLARCAWDEVWKRRRGAGDGQSKG